MRLNKYLAHCGVASRRKCDQLIQEGKIAIRNVRRDSNESLKKSEKNHEISEDDLKRSLDNIQEITNEYINQLNEIQSNKEKEILN